MIPQRSEDEQVAKREDGFVDRAGGGGEMKISAQIVAAAHHGDGCGVCQWDHHGQDGNGCEAKPPVPYDMPRGDEPALDEKHEEPDEEDDSMGGGEQGERCWAAGGMGDGRDEGGQGCGDHGERHPGEEPAIRQRACAGLREGGMGCVGHGRFVSDGTFLEAELNRGRESEIVKMRHPGAR